MVAVRWSIGHAQAGMESVVADILAVFGSLAFFALCAVYAKGIDMMAGA